MSEIDLEKELLYRELYFHKSPSQFLEDMFGIELFPYQKLAINCVMKNKFSKEKNKFSKKWKTVLTLMNIYKNMKDDDCVNIVINQKIKKMNKGEFEEYLKKYWKEYWGEINDNG